VRFNFKALGRKRQGFMNKTEAAYQVRLEGQKAQGLVAWYRFEGIKLRLADKTFYSPDFFVMKTNGELEVHEVKGFMLDDANVKIKVAAENYPFKFIVVKLKRGTWEEKEV
jgi:hypothetical protein